MIDFERLEKEVGMLDKLFLNLLLFNLMKKGKLNFIELSNQYVKYLESEKSDAAQLTHDLGYSLMHHRYPDIVGGKTKQDKLNFINKKAISALKRTKLFPDDFDYMKDLRNLL